MLSVIRDIFSRVKGYCVLVLVVEKFKPFRECSKTITLSVVPKFLVSLTTIKFIIYFVDDVVVATFGEKCSSLCHQDRVLTYHLTERVQLLVRKLTFFTDSFHSLSGHDGAKDPLFVASFAVGHVAPPMLGRPGSDGFRPNMYNNSRATIPQGVWKNHTFH